MPIRSSRFLFMIFSAASLFVSVTSAQTTLSSMTNRQRNRFYSSAFRHPLTPRDVAAREAIRKLAVDRHHFLRVELRDGSSFTGGVISTHDEYFLISQGILGQKDIRYSSLKVLPRPVAAPAEHLENGLKWTGLVGGCVILSPLLIVVIPLVAAGVIQD